MYYSGYCQFNSQVKLELDNLRVENNRKKLINDLFSSKQVCNGFILGATFVTLFDTLPAWADDLQPTKQAKKELGKRISNAIGCGAITFACSKAAQSPEAVQTAANQVAKTGNPKVIAAFACGAAVAWCAKYAIFDK